MKFTKAILGTLKQFGRDESGQDLVEYTMLLAFITLASAAIFVSVGGSISTIWGNTSSTLSTAVNAS